MSKPACLWNSFSKNSTLPSTAPGPPATAPALFATISLTATALYAAAKSHAAAEFHATTSSNCPCFYACTSLGTPPACGAWDDTGEAPPAGLRGEYAGPPASRHVPAHVDLSRCLGLSFPQALHTCKFMHSFTCVQPTVQPDCLRPACSSRRQLPTLQQHITCVREAVS